MVPHPEYKYFLLEIVSKFYFTANYCSKLTVKLFPAIYNHTLADAMCLTMIPAGSFSFLSLFLAETRHALHFSLQVRNPDVKAPDFCFYLPAELQSLTAPLECSILPTEID